MENEDRNLSYLIAEHDNTVNRIERIKEALKDQERKDFVDDVLIICELVEKHL